MNKFSDKKRKTLFTAVIVMAALTLTAFPAMAQTGAGGAQGGQQSYQQGMQGQQPGTQNFDDQTLEKFASATVQVGNIQSDFGQKLQGVQDREKATEMQREANQKMIEAVQNSGLDVETYNDIASQMNLDQQLKNKVDQMIKQQSS